MSTVPNDGVRAVRFLETLEPPVLVLPDSFTPAAFSPGNAVVDMADSVCSFFAYPGSVFYFTLGVPSRIREIPLFVNKLGAYFHKKKHLAMPMVYISHLVAIVNY